MICHTPVCDVINPTESIVSLAFCGERVVGLYAIGIVIFYHILVCV